MTGLTQAHRQLFHRCAGLIVSESRDRSGSPGLDASGLGFGRAVPALMGRPPYDPRDLVKLYLYGDLNEVRSSRRLERECSRNLEVMWLLRRLAPDFKTIADFRRDNGAAIVGACRAFVL